MKHRALVIPLASGMVLAAAAACAAPESVAPVAGNSGAPVVAAASGGPAPLTAAEYVSLLQRLHARLDERESDFVSLDTTGPTPGRYVAAIARTREQKRLIQSMLVRGRRVLAAVTGGVTAAICTDDGAPDECDDDDGSGGSGGSGGAPPWNTTEHSVLNPRGAAAGLSLATSIGIVTVTGVFHNHHIQVSGNNTILFSDSVKTNATYIGSGGPFGTERLYTTQLTYNICGYASGWATHTFSMSGGVPNEVLNSQNDDFACREEEQTTESGGGGGGGDEREGDIWC
jgi:hypothetical protein